MLGLGLELQICLWYLMVNTKLKEYVVGYYGDLCVTYTQVIEV